jgi:pimeloyl-ACP methyl ester carboxylesterase
MRSVRYICWLLGIGVIVAMACVDPTLAGEAKTTGYYVDVGSREAPVRLWVEEHGQGEPVLMIHGLGASIYTWRHLIPDLSRSFRIIAVDLKGAGKSDKPLDEAYGILDQAALLKVFVDRKGLSNLTIVGHSFGGGVALALALDLNETSPGMLKRLVLLASVAYRQQLPFVELLKKNLPLVQSARSRCLQKCLRTAACTPPITTPARSALTPFASTRFPCMSRPGNTPSLRWPNMSSRPICRHSSHATGPYNNLRR